MGQYILELRGITKIFPGVKALDRVDFTLKEGEIHALMGENGAGKSTFIKVITGVHEPEEGEIYLRGRRVQFKSPRDAQQHSIAAIYQHGTAYPHLSVTENIFAGHEKAGRLGVLRWGAMHKEAAGLLSALGSDISPKSHMGDLTVAEQQIVEVAKAISTRARIIIMDEPTAALSRRECEELYRITAKLREDGVSIIFISHRFEDMRRLADRVTVLRDARYVGTYNAADITDRQLISAMVGREIDQIYPVRSRRIGGEVFRAEKLRRTGYFYDVSFTVRSGEIFALTGLVGAGRSEVCRAIFGIDRLDGGEIRFGGKKIRVRHPIHAMRIGLGYLPEDRQRQGLVLEWELYKNETLATLEQFARHGVINSKRERDRAKTLSERLSIKAVSVFDRASSLSGGNQQKVIVAKLLNSDLKMIILDEPTKGVDVGSKSQIYEIMAELAGEGYAILMVSSEMPEVLGMADRVAVMNAGRITAVFDRTEATQEKILEAAMRAHNRTLAAGGED